MEVNLKNSQVIVFNSAGRLLSGYSFLYGNKKLEQVKTYCYLGVEISCSGSFGIVRNCRIKKAQKAHPPMQVVHHLIHNVR